MIFVYQRSATPITPWDALRHGGVNNLDAGIKARYLVLWNVDIVQREGAWHYIFQFDARDTLQLNALAQLTGKKASYPNDINWRRWLGDQPWQVISESVREEILSLPPEFDQPGAMITDMRQVPHARRIPGRRPDDPPYQPPPEHFVIALPGAS
jgi:hypothetical protein